MIAIAIAIAMIMLAAYPSPVESVNFDSNFIFRTKNLIKSS